VQGRSAVTEATQSALKQIGGLGVIAEDNNGLGNVFFGRDQGVQERFAMRHGHLEICLFKSWRDATLVFGRDLGYEDWRFVLGARQRFQGPHLGRQSRSEQERLPF
jgi:hypothetical protein